MIAPSLGRSNVAIISRSLYPPAGGNAQMQLCGPVEKAYNNRPITTRIGMNHEYTRRDHAFLNLVDRAAQMSRLTPSPPGAIVANFTRLYSP